MLETLLRVFLNEFVVSSRDSLAGDPAPEDGSTLAPEFLTLLCDYFEAVCLAGLSLLFVRQDPPSSALGPTHLGDIVINGSSLARTIFLLVFMTYAYWRHCWVEGGK